MKKALSIFAMIVLLISLASCGGSTPSSSSQTSVSSTDPLFDQVEAKAQFEQAVEACADVIDGFVIDMKKSAYPMPTPEEYAQMSQAIGTLGFPVDFYDLDMPNYEKVEAFWNEVQAGKDTQIIIYGLYNWGITADILIHRDGKDFRTMAAYDFLQGTADIKSKIEFEEPVYRLDRIYMTEKGYLLYHIPEQDGFSEMYRGYRISPLGEEIRVLGSRYIEGIGYIANGMLKYTWNKDDFSQLNMNWVFESLYYKFNGEFPEALYKELDENGHVLIPADVMEGIMLNSLPLTKEQLRSFIPFNEVNHTYAYEAFAGGGYSPIPEVVNIIKNADGSLSLTIDAVAVEFGEDKSMSSVLTVMDNTDGSIRYLSNTVITPLA
ncbi:DUF6070 family protein [Marasmitruncus massiliensis]|uniref:DUF6070 family protein n=1 Tax=Marasmitruncus massiliensis TaxID=1944642 RepID=UPI000C79E374|nr:DUF6070 family protein [Marasmitruncus massiliensis]